MNKLFLYFTEYFIFRIIENAMHPEQNIGRKNSVGENQSRKLRFFCSRRKRLAASYRWICRYLIIKKGK